MKKIYIVLLVLLCVVEGLKDRCANVKTPLSSIRKRRFLTFPPNTNFVMTVASFKTIMVHVPSGWNMILEVDVQFPLASPEMLNELYRKKLHHRQKRDLWERLQSALESYNMNGLACTYRSICEAKAYLAPPGKSLVHDILRAIFHAPVHEEGFKEEINDSYGELLDPDFCDSHHDCPVSILDIILTLNKRIH